MAVRILSCYRPHENSEFLLLSFRFKFPREYYGFTPDFGLDGDRLESVTRTDSCPLLAEVKDGDLQLVRNHPNLVQHCPEVDFSTI